MPRYLIERTYTVDMESVPTVGTRSKAIRHYHYPEIVWEHSHVVLDADGTPKSFCVYSAPMRSWFANTPTGWATTSSRGSTRSPAT